MTSAFPRPMAPQRYYQVMTFQKSVFWQTFVCVVPSGSLLLAGFLSYSVYVLFACLLPLLAFHTLRRDALMYSSLLVGTMPMVMSLRGYVPGTYTLPEVLVVAGVVLWIEARKSEAQVLLKKPFAVILMVLSTAYWLVSFYATGDYAANMRAMEMAFGALNVFLLGRYRSYLGSALLSMSFSLGVFALAALPRSERLGEFMLEDQKVGSPQAFGVFATMVLFLTFADDARWLLFVRKSNALRWFIRAMAGGAVLLSTSRAAWAIAVIGIAVMYWYDHRKRMEIANSVGLMVVTGILLIGVGAGGTFEDYLDKTFSTEQSLEKLTTGRASQWEAMPAVIAASPVWGHGPGDGRYIAAEYAGRELIWHSLYLQIIAETGLLGLALVLIPLAFLVDKCFSYLQRTGEVMPLVGVLGFTLISLGVPGLDAASSVYVGLALIGCDYSRWRVVRPAPAQVQEAYAGGLGPDSDPEAEPASGLDIDADEYQPGPGAVPSDAPLR